MEKCLFLFVYVVCLFLCLLVRVLSFNPCWCSTVPKETIYSTIYWKYIEPLCCTTTPMQRARKPSTTWEQQAWMQRQVRWTWWVRRTVFHDFHGWAGFHLFAPKDAMGMNFICSMYVLCIFLVLAHGEEAPTRFEGNNFYEVIIEFFLSKFSM